MKNFIRQRSLVFIAVLALFLMPQTGFAGGLKGKIQQRLNAPSNVQSFQSDEYFRNGNLREEEKRERNKKDLDQLQAAGQAGYEYSYAADAPAASMPVAASDPMLSSYAIYKADYNAELEENVVTVKGKVIFEVFNKRGWTQIPLVQSNVGLIDAKVNKGASFVTMQDGKYYLMIDKAGRYNLEIEYLIKASREREAGPGSFSVEVVPAPISQFEFMMPETGVEIFVEPAIKVELDKQPAKTIAWAVMPNTSSVSVRWTAALPKEQIDRTVKLEPKVYADTMTYTSIGEGIVRSQTTVNYSILQSEVSNFRLSLPEDVSLLDVSGSDLRDWKVSKADGVQYLDVYLNFGVKGNYVLYLNYERNIGEGSVVAQIPSVKTVGTERENGYFGIAARTNVELAVNKSERVTPIDIKELPSSIWGQSAHPILLAFKYLNHPFDITIEVTKHEELPVLIAAIDSVNYVTLHTEDGKILTKATYNVRNNVKQFLHLILPKDSALWSTFVSGKPVKPAKDKNGTILIPLEKSQLQGQSLTQFPVEIVYLDKSPKMNFLGNIKLDLPQTDVPISELYWSVYLPVNYSYFNFRGDVKPVKGLYQASVGGALSSTISGLARGGRLASRADDVGEQFSPGNVNVSMEYWGKESSQVTGVLPIEVNIPRQGKLLQFSKLLVTEKESSSLSLNYTGLWIKLQGPVKFFALLILVFFLWRRIKTPRKKAALNNLGA